MAKLNGVVLTAEAIEYSGVKYEKIDVTPQAGDILRVDETSYEDVTTGAFYEVESIDSNDDPQIIDNDGDAFDGYFIEYTLFRKVTEPQASVTQQYREVNREAKVGERIKIVEPYMSGGRYKKGDELIVYSVDRDASGDVRIMINGERALVARKEYVVLEPIAEQSEDILEVDGVKYRKVDRNPKIGDYIIARSRKRDVTEGKIYEVTHVDSGGDPIFKDDAGDFNYTKTYEVVERITTSDDLERQVSELQTKLAEAESKLATQKAEEEKAKDPRSAFAKGDKVRLINGGDEHPLRGYKNGEVYNVSDPLYSYSNKIEITGGTLRTGYALPSQLAKLSEREIAEMNRLKVGEYAKVIGGDNVNTKVGDIVAIRSVHTGAYEINSLDGREFSGLKFERNVVRATDEEVAEARRKLEQSKYSVGDYVKVLVDTEDLDEGAIGKVTRVDTVDGEWPIKVELLNGRNCDWYKPEQLEKVAEEVVQWAAIGRGVGELKEGDVVEITANTNDSVNSIGSIGTVGERSRSGSYRVETGMKSLGNWTIPSEMKLIAPVESVVNLATAN